jgi:Kef-type K+ transport system membrane component KefB
MTIEIIIALCSLLLLTYLFDISSAFTRIPSVIILLLLGWVMRQASDFFQIPVPNLNPLLPIFGTIGLILIVLEGSLELELNKSKVPVIKKPLMLTLIPMLASAFIFTETGIE